MVEMSFKKLETLKNKIKDKISNRISSNVKPKDIKHNNVYDIRALAKNKKSASVTKRGSVVSEKNGTKRTKRSTGKNKKQEKTMLYGMLGLAMLLILFVLVATHKNAYEIAMGDKVVGIINQKGLEEDIYKTVVAQIETVEGSKIKADTGFEITSKAVRAGKKELVTTDYIISQIKKEMGYTIEASVLSVAGVEMGILKNEQAINAATDKILNSYTLENAEIVEKGFVEDVVITPKFVTKAEIITSEDLYNKLTQTVETSKVYVVKSGDSLWSIANSNGLTLNQILKINPGITENTILKLDSELMLVVPKPLLSAKMVTHIKYTETIPRSVEYETDETQFKTYKQTKQQGADGVKEVLASIIYINGYEEEREVVSETVTKEPIPDIVVTGTKAIPAKAATGSFKRPLSGGMLSSPFGSRWGSFHTGIDLAAPRGTAIYASDGGTVKEAGWGGSYGYLVVIDHGNGFETYYAHCSVINVKVGQKVGKSEKIAAVGSTGNSTGNHVHFEVRQNGTPYNPLNYIK